MEFSTYGNLPLRHSPSWYRPRISIQFEGPAIQSPGQQGDLAQNSGPGKQPLEIGTQVPHSVGRCPSKLKICPHDLNLSL